MSFLASCCATRGSSRGTRGGIALHGWSRPRAAAGPWVLAATILGSSMAFIDGTVVNVALPALQADLGATRAGVPNGSSRPTRSSWRR